MRLMPFPLTYKVNSFCCFFFFVLIKKNPCFCFPLPGAFYRIGCWFVYKDIVSFYIFQNESCNIQVVKIDEMLLWNFCSN